MLRQHVSSFAELETYISELDPPDAGTVRVFRGQSKPHPLVPSGRRRPIVHGSIWAHYSRQMIYRIQQQGPDDDFEREAQLWLVWLQALAQHYGAGSKYLDVTHDLGMAVWFAVNESSSATLKSVVGSPDDSGDDAVVETHWVRLTQHSAPAYIYVLDLEPYELESLPNAGDLVDLMDAPSIFHSPRIKAQSGCLVWADEDQDLKSYAVCEILLENGAENSPYEAWTVEQVFPPPAIDEWYARFLELPFLVAADADSEQACLRQSLPTTLFLPAPKSDYVADIRSRFRYLFPPLVSESLQGMGESPEKGGSGEFSFPNATTIVLEGPQISAYPPLDSYSWNYELLLEDWSEDVDTYEITSDKVSERVPLKSVLIEISPLDEVGWYDGEPIDEGMLRAVWIRRDEKGVSAYLFLQNYPSPSIEPIGPLILRLNAQRRLAIDDPEGGTDLASFGRYGKAIVACLVLIRDCSPIPKAAAYPECSAGGGDDSVKHVIPVSSAAARLYKTAGYRSRPWYVARDPGGAPFTVAQPNLGEITVTAPTLNFADVSAADIQRYVANVVEEEK